MDGIKSLAVVALLADKPEAGLKRGDVGTVVEVFESNEHHPGGCIVEFVDETGNTPALLELSLTVPPAGLPAGKGHARS